jgi:hypothetical protein
MEQEHRPNQKTLSTIQLAAYGFMGAFMACLIDYLQNDTAAVSLKIQTALQNMLQLEVHGAINVFFISLLGALACNLQKSKSHIDAFTRGLAVFTFFNLITPNHTPREPKINDTSIEAQGAIPRMPVFEFASFQQSRTNGIIMIETPWMSKTKPEYSGPGGMGSLLNNTIDINKIDDTLSAGKEVEIVCYWDTPLRGYRYAFIKYTTTDGDNRCAWIYAGKEPEYWANVKPLNGSESIQEYSGSESCTTPG